MKVSFKVLDKYLFKQVLFASLVSLLLFTVIWIAPELLLKVIKRTLAGFLTPQEGVLMIIYEIPKILGKALPVGMLLGSLFTFDKISKDSELTIMRSVGISFSRILLPVIVLSLFFTALCFVTYDKLIPMSTEKLYIIKKEEGRSSHFVWTDYKSTMMSKQLIIISDYSQKHISNITVINFANENYTDANIVDTVLIADNAIKFKDKWLLTKGISYSINKAGVFDKIEPFENISILNSPNEAEIVYQLMLNSLKRDRDFTNKELKQYSDILKKENMINEYNFMFNKYLQRFIHPLICILFAILGGFLGYSKPREQRLVGFTVAIGIIFVYYITLPFFDLIAEKGLLSPWIAAPLPLILLASSIWYMKNKKGL